MCGHSYAGIQDLIDLLPDTLDCDARVGAFLRMATDDVDLLTFHRIPARGGLDALTPAQRERVVSVTAQLAAWQYQYGDQLEFPFTSYSVNGVSMGMDSSRIVQVSGVTIPRRLYDLLCETGLCYRGLA